MFTTENNVNSGAVWGFQMSFRMVVIVVMVQEVRCLHRDDVHQDSSAIHSTSSRMGAVHLVVSTSPASLVIYLLVMVRVSKRIIFVFICCVLCFHLTIQSSNLLMPFSAIFLSHHFQPSVPIFFSPSHSL